MLHVIMLSAFKVNVVAPQPDIRKTLKRVSLEINSSPSRCRRKKGATTFSTTTLSITTLSIEALFETFSITTLSIKALFGDLA